jgi:hypothetical protein
MGGRTSVWGQEKGVSHNDEESDGDKGNDLTMPLTVEDPQFPGGRQAALKLPLVLANTTKSSTRVNLLS